MKIKDRLGIHFRLENSYSDLAKKTQEYDIQYCQFFLFSQKTLRYHFPKEEDKKEFLELSKKYLKKIFVHSAYWINACSGNEIGFKRSLSTIKKEINLAKELGITNLIMHSGSAKHFLDTDIKKAKAKGIKSLIKFLDAVFEETDATILIENVAHGHKTIGNEFEDLKIIKDQVKQKNRLRFCFDTSHAFAYGYDLENTEEFVKILDSTAGIENIDLIHLNDSAKKQGSKIDEHAIPGKGKIGKEILRNLVTHPKLQNIPMIVEAPPMSDAANKEMLNEIRNW